LTTSDEAQGCPSCPRWQPFFLLTMLLTLVACIAADPEIATPDRPRRVHCGLPTKTLLLTDSGGGLQHQHLVRRDREASNLILWGLLGSSRARCTEDDNCCSQGCGNHIQDFLFHGPPHVGVEFSIFNMQRTGPTVSRITDGVDSHQSQFGAISGHVVA
jgi:hypothetical protein